MWIWSGNNMLQVFSFYVILRSNYFWYSATFITMVILKWSTEPKQDDWSVEAHTEYHDIVEYPQMKRKLYQTAIQLAMLKDQKLAIKKNISWICVAGSRFAKMKEWKIAESRKYGQGRWIWQDNNTTNPWKIGCGDTKWLHVCACSHIIYISKP